MITIKRENFLEEKKITPNKQTIGMLASISLFCKPFLLTVIYVPSRPNRSTSQTDELEDAEES